MSQVRVRWVKFCDIYLKGIVKLIFNTVKLSGLLLD